MEILGLTKLTLLDYPKHIGSTIFSPRCNMRCPFCHNKDLVLPTEQDIYFSEKTIFDFLNKRKDVLEGICITGGEPTLQGDLKDFIRKIKKLGLKVKLDTNGLRPDVIVDCLEDNLLDYIAMDIKNSLKKYPLTCDIPDIDTSKIVKSIELIMDSPIDYEFRTTVIKEFHSYEDILLIGQLINGAKQYSLQQYQASPNQLTCQHYHTYNETELLAFKEALLPYIRQIELKGL